jgi:hypothetical protein
MTRQHAKALLWTAHNMPIGARWHLSAMRMAAAALGCMKSDS